MEIHLTKLIKSDGMPTELKEINSSIDLEKLGAVDWKSIWWV